MSIFRAYDVRGIYPRELNKKIVEKLGKAFGTFNPGKIVIGMDARLSSPILKESLAKGLLSTGCKVIDIGMVTTPVLMFGVKHLKADGGVMVTASHNPKEYNGLKFYSKNAIPLSYESGINKIKGIMEKEDFLEGRGILSRADVLEDYSRFLLEKIKFKKKIRVEVVVDASNGPAGLIVPKVLRRIGLKVHELFCKPDGNFPGHEPDPSNERNLTKLKEKVLEVGADIGLAYDGDGDRLGVVDELGNIVNSIEVFGLLIMNELNENPHAMVVHDILIPSVIPNLIRKYDCTPVVSRVGYAYVRQKMTEVDALLGGEVAGHYYFKETFWFDDPLFTSLKLIEFLMKTGKSVSGLVKLLPKYFYKTMRVPVDENKKHAVIERIKELAMKENYKVDFLDGVKILLDYGWVVFRPSNTEPKISIAYEAKDEKNFNRLRIFVENMLREVMR